MSSLFDLMRKTNEAQAVRLGLPINRQYSDDELVESIQALADAEHELALELGTMSSDEYMGKLGPDEQRLLNELNRKLIPFRVTVTLPDRTEQINILATDACHANIRVVEMVFGDFDSEKPQSFRVKVEPVQTCNLRRAA
jgi:hypothetical protein